MRVPARRIRTLSTLVMAMAGTLFFRLSSVAYSQDLSALQTHFTAQMEALNSEDLDATLAGVHDDIVLFGLFSPFPIEGKPAFRQAVQEYFDDYTESAFMIIEPSFRLIGPTGVAWGYYRLSAKLATGVPSRSYGRYLFTYTRVDGSWQVVSMHLSPLVQFSEGSGE